MIVWFDEGSLSGFTAACGTTAHADNRSSSTNCSGGGRIAVVVAASGLKAANYKSSVYFQHPSVTRSVCTALGTATPSPAATFSDLLPIEKPRFVSPVGRPSGRPFFFAPERIAPSRSG